MKIKTIIAIALVFGFLLSGCIEEIENGDENAITPNPSITPTPSPTQTPKPNLTPTPKPRITPTPKPSIAPTPEPEPQEESFELEIPPKGYFSIPVKDPNFTMEIACKTANATSIKKYPKNTDEKIEVLYCTKDKEELLEPGYVYYTIGRAKRSVTVTGKPWSFPKIKESAFSPTIFGTYFGGTFEVLNKSDILGDCNSDKVKIIDLVRNKGAEEIEPGSAYKVSTTESNCTLGITN